MQSNGLIKLSYALALRAPRVAAPVVQAAPRVVPRATAAARSPIPAKVIEINGVPVRAAGGFRNFIKAHPYATAALAGVPLAAGAYYGLSGSNGGGPLGPHPAVNYPYGPTGGYLPPTVAAALAASLAHQNPYMRPRRRRGKKQRALRRRWRKFNQGWKDRNNPAAPAPVETMPVSAPAPTPVAPAPVAPVAPAPVAPVTPAPVAPVAPEPVVDSASLQPASATPTLSVALPGGQSHVVSRRAIGPGNVPVPRELQKRIDDANMESYLRGGIANLAASDVNQNYTGGKYGVRPTPPPTPNPFL